jgi:hypothetical protein
MNKIVTVVSKALANSPTGVTFFGIKNYKNAQGEISDYTINIGTNFAKAKAKDFEYVSNLDVSTLDTNISIEILNEAKQILTDALLKPNKAQSEAQKNAYTHINHAIKVHNETDVIYVFGTKVRKATISSGNYNEVDTRRELTKAKDVIRKGFKSTNYRQFKVEPQETNAVAFSGASETILVEMV